MKPLNSLIAVYYEEPKEQKTESGLYVPPSVDNNAHNFLKQGEVKAINADCKYINIGDKVLFNKNATTKVPGQDNILLIRTEDLYAVL